jgi:phosphoglycolate phosphatase-like HAD superfamily hydrolase
MDDYLAHYDPSSVRPFPGVEDLISKLDRWAVFSNKLGAAGESDLRSLGWEPEAALFHEAFGAPKTLDPVLTVLGLNPDDIVCVGDSEHDRACARAVGAVFVLAGWNARTVPAEDDIVLAQPVDLFDVL